MTISEILIKPDLKYVKSFGIKSKFRVRQTYHKATFLSQDIVLLYNNGPIIFNRKKIEALCET